MEISEQKLETQELQTLDLSNEEVRVIGCLIEKELTTPDYYPLTLNSLLAACNQSTNRKPVVSYNDVVVEQTLKELRIKKLSTIGVYPGSRVPKHKHALNLPKPEISILATLMLRGEQTLGEIKQNSNRMNQWRDLNEVEQTLLNLEDKELVKKLPKVPGQKEERVRHLLTKTNQDNELLEPHQTKNNEESVTIQNLLVRIEKLEIRLDELEEKI
jgi:uncharacterized protein YceH (UPF0502 family)